MTRLVVLAVLTGMLVIACSSSALAPVDPRPDITTVAVVESTPDPVPVDPRPDITTVAVVESTPDIDATVEARLAHERAVDATVEARLAEEKVSDAKPTSTLVPQATNPSKTEPTETPTLVPTATSVPLPSPSPIPTTTPRPEPTQALGAVFTGKWGTQGAGNGQFDSPYGVAVASDGSVYVADLSNHRIQKFTSSGVYISQWGTLGTGNGLLDSPFGVAVAPDGNVYVADTRNNRIQKFTSTGEIIGKWGTIGTGTGQFQYPYGVAVASDGSVYVADTLNHRIQKFTSSGVFVSKWGTNGTDDGQFDSPYGVAVASDSSVYVTDTLNHRIQKFTSSGVYIIKWGTNGTDDGEFDSPYGVAVASDSSVYVADGGNNRVQKFSVGGVSIPAPPTPTPSPTPTVVFWPSSGLPGSQIDITGVGFTPNSFIEAGSNDCRVSGITLAGKCEEGSHARTEVSSLGDFILSYTVPSDSVSNSSGTLLELKVTDSRGVTTSNAFFNLIVANSTPPTPTPIPTPRPTATPQPSRATSFGDGTWIVGSDIKSGTYRSSQTGNSCYWQRLSGFSGEFDDIIVNELTEAISIVAISSADAGFSTDRCGTWTEAISSITSSLSSPFGDGAYVVGLDIGPGTWTSPGGDSCYWERLLGFSGDISHIEANGLGASNVVLTIKSTDAGFKSSNCGTWTKTG